MGNIGCLISGSTGTSRLATSPRLMKSIGLSLLLVIASAAQAAGPAPAKAAPQAPTTPEQSAKEFVQGFYDWYTAGFSPESHGPRDHDDRSPKGVLKNKRWPMSAAIISALEEDMAAQDKSPGFIVGIDFDPYLNAQDTCFPYKTGAVTRAGELYRVEVFASNCADLVPGRPVVVAALKRRGASWEFANFIYPGNPDDDLLANLKGLKQYREEHPNQAPNQDSDQDSDQDQPPPR